MTRYFVTSDDAVYREGELAYIPDDYQEVWLSTKPPEPLPKVVAQQDGYNVGGWWFSGRSSAESYSQQAQSAEERARRLRALANHLRQRELDDLQAGNAVIQVIEQMFSDTKPKLTAEQKQNLHKLIEGS